MADHAHGGVIGEHTFQLFICECRAIRDADLAGMDRSSNADSAPMVDADPGGS